jgi:hypothetical protein
VPEKSRPLRHALQPSGTHSTARVKLASVRARLEVPARKRRNAYDMGEAVREESSSDVAFNRRKKRMTGFLPN